MNLRPLVPQTSVLPSELYLDNDGLKTTLRLSGTTPKFIVCAVYGLAIASLIEVGRRRGIRTPIQAPKASVLPLHYVLCIAEARSAVR